MKNYKTFFQAAIKFVFVIMMLMVIFMVTCFSYLSSYITAQNFLIPAGICLLIAIVFVILFCFIYKRSNIHDAKILKSSKTIIITSLVLLMLQLFVCYSVFFLTSWDSEVLTVNAFNIAHNKIGNLNNDYFSRFPNNLFLEYLFILAYKFADFIEMSTLKTGTELIVIGQCVLNSMTGFLTFKIAEKISNSYKAAWCTWAFYFILVGSAFWTIVPYSDSIALIIPVLILWIWTTLKTEKYTYLKWFLIIVITFIGYKIKPQTVIVFIAIVIIQAIYAGYNRKIFLRLIKAVVPAMVVVMLLNVGIGKAVSTLPFNIDKEAEFGMTHFLMMGLNEESGGIYDKDDIDFSNTIETKEERKKANIDESIRRLKSFTPRRLAKHIARKTVSNYGNGMFGWGQEAGSYFYKEVYRDRVPGISGFLKKCIYNTGDYYRIFAIIKQFTWIMCLLLCALSCMRRDKSVNEAVLVIALSIIGLTMFETLFEPRARYFYIYVPFYVILAPIGLRNVLEKFKSKKDKKERV